MASETVGLCPEESMNLSAEIPVCPKGLEKNYEIIYTVIAGSNANPYLLNYVVVISKLYRIESFKIIYCFCYVVENVIKHILNQTLKTPKLYPSEIAVINHLFLSSPLTYVNTHTYTCMDRCVRILYHNHSFILYKSC